jgi:hypothetical protein
MSEFQAAGSHEQRFFLLLFFKYIVITDEPGRIVGLRLPVCDFFVKIVKLKSEMENCRGLVAQLVRAHA